MKLYTWANKDATIIQYIAWYDDEYILCIDTTDGMIDTYNVLESYNFEDMDLKEIDMPRNIIEAFIKFLFICEFDGGDASDIA